MLYLPTEGMVGPEIYEFPLAFRFSTLLINDEFLIENFTKFPTNYKISNVFEITSYMVMEEGNHSD